MSEEIKKIEDTIAILRNSHELHEAREAFSRAQYARANLERLLPLIENLKSVEKSLREEISKAKSMLKELTEQRDRSDRGERYEQQIDKLRGLGLPDLESRLKILRSLEWLRDRNLWRQAYELGFNLDDLWFLRKQGLTDAQSIDEFLHNAKEKLEEFKQEEARARVEVELYETKIKKLEEERSALLKQILQG